MFFVSFVQFLFSLIFLIPNQYHFFTIHIIFPTNHSTFRVDVIEGDRRGTFGAGGNIGRFRSMLGINDGNSGNLGGAGSSGMLGIFGDHVIFAHAPTVRSTLIVGGVGNSGNAGSVIVFGTK